MSLLWRLFGPRRGCGYLPDPPDPRDMPFGALALPPAAPASASLARFASIRDQGGTSSCVAHALAQGLYVAHLAAGSSSYVMPSRRFLYWHARGYHGDELTDGGTFPRTAMKGLIRFGAPTEKHCAWDPRLVNRSPAFAAYRHAFDQRGLKGYCRIDSDGDERLDEIRRAIAAARPVIFGTGVSRAFLDFSGTGTADAPASIVGRHAMCIVGYETGRFRVANSWGTAWGDSGFAWLSEDYLAWPDTRDLWALDIDGGSNA